jgi:aminomethyltransferase
LKPLPLAELHRELGAKFGAFAGYDMPLSYPAGVLKEHLHTRAEAGLFDISHMRHVEIAGADAAKVMARLCPYPAAEQAERLARYTFFLNDSGGIIDDLMVTRLGPDRYRIVCNAGSADKDIAHLRANLAGRDARLTIVDCAFLALQGPKAEAALKSAGVEASAMTFLQAAEPRKGWFLTRSGYTGEDGFEIALPVAEASELAWRLLGEPAVRPIGLGARDSLRLEAGLSLYGQDLGEDISPLEAGLAWAIPKTLRSGGSFIGAAALARMAAMGAPRKRIGLRPQGAAPVRAHAPILDAEGRKAGEVTSGGFGPSVGHPVAMALVASSALPPFFAEVRGQRLPVDVTPLPFAPHRYKRA